MTKDHKRMIKKSYKDFVRREELDAEISAAFMGIATWIPLYFLFFS